MSGSWYKFCASIWWIGALFPSASLGSDTGGPLGFYAEGIERCRERRSELTQNAIIYIEQPAFEGQGVALTACGLIDAAPSEVWPVLRDCGEYEDFLPGVVQSALRRREGDTRFCEARIDLPFPLGDLQSVERARERGLQDGGFERRWSLERGNYRRLEGMWTLLPSGPGGRQTLAVYQLDMDPQTVVPDFLLRRTQSSTAPDLFAAVRKRVQQCADGCGR